MFYYVGASSIIHSFARDTQAPRHCPRDCSLITFYRQRAATAAAAAVHTAHLRSWCVFSLDMHTTSNILLSPVYMSQLAGSFSCHI